MTTLIGFFFAYDNDDDTATVGRITDQVTDQYYLIEKFDYENDNEVRPDRELVTLCQIASEQWRLFPDKKAFEQFCAEEFLPPTKTQDKGKIVHISKGTVQ